MSGGAPRHRAGSGRHRRELRSHIAFPARISLIALTALIGLVAVATTIGGDQKAAGRERAANCHDQGADYPRTATYYLSQQALPAVADLAHYDVVVIDSEWAHRVPRTWFQRLRAADPGVCLLAYVNLVDRPDRLGTHRYWADRYSLWQFTVSGTSTFPRRWLAVTGSGKHVSEWPGTSMANLTAHAPMVEGQTYAQYAANWVADTVWATGLWDGILLDVWGDRVYNADIDAWDSNGDGVDEPASRIYGAGSPWARGLADAERIMRARMPAAVLVANGDRTLGGTGLDGLAWESFADPESGRDPLTDLRDYVDTTARRSGQDGLAITIDRRRSPRGSVEAGRAARFQLASTLLQGGFWAPMGADYGELARYDEMGLGSLSRGYLGRPVAESPTWAALRAPFHDGVGSLEPDLYRRDFTNGIVLVNAGTGTRTVTLEHPYTTVPGAWGTKTNNRMSTTSVAVPPQDGVVLLRANS
jgi:hypothetical protein